MSGVFLSLFALAAAANALSIRCKRARIQAVAKICLLPLLAAYYCTEARLFLPQVMLALFFGWVGDLFLIKIKRPYFVIAGLSGFLIGHLCYIFSLLPFIALPHMSALVVSSAGICAFALGVFAAVKPAKKLLAPAVCYSLALAALLVCAVQLMLCRRDAAGFSIAAGSLCFLASDTVLAYFSCRKMTPRVNFAVMLTYSAAQSCLIIGLAHCR